MRFLLLVLLLLPASGFTQSLSGPESVEADKTSSSYYVSNTGTGEVVRFFPSGTVQSFASGFTFGPHGLELVGDSLYVCDGSTLRLVDPVSGSILQSFNLGASFLNGITHRGPYLFITDFSAKQIYRFNTKTNAYNVMLSLTKTPNGIVYDNLLDRLVFVCWGSAAPVYQVSLSDSSLTLLTTTSTGNCDGIAMDCSGNFYVSSWSPNTVKIYPSDFSSSVGAGMTGIASPADIYFDSTNDSLFVPNSSNNTISMAKFSSCLTGLSENNIDFNVTVFPNPVSDYVSIQTSAKIDRIELHDANGRLINCPIQYGNFSAIIGVKNLSYGIYTVTVISNQSQFRSKLVKQ